MPTTTPGGYKRSSHAILLRQYHTLWIAKNSMPRLHKNCGRKTQQNTQIWLRKQRQQGRGRRSHESRSEAAENSRRSLRYLTSKISSRYLNKTFRITYARMSADISNQSPMISDPVGHVCGVVQAFFVVSLNNVYIFSRSWPSTLPFKSQY